ncbi:MAG: hypothetical protein ACRDQI_06490 [Pseudonocardiaceae bacterium]
MSTPTTAAPTVVPTVPAKFSGLAVTSLVLGLIGCVFSVVPILDVVTMLAAIVGAVLGIVAVFGTRRVLATSGVVLCVLACVFTGLAMSSFSTTVSKDLPSIGHDPSAVSDVAVSGCSVSSDYGTTMTHATVKITNSTPRTQSYMATISVNDAAGARIGEINTVSNSLAAGQSVILTGMGATGTATSAAKPGPAACVIANVDRFPS